MYMGRFISSPLFGSTEYGHLCSPRFLFGFSERAIFLQIGFAMTLRLLAPFVRAGWQDFWRVAERSGARENIRNDEPFHGKAHLSHLRG